MNKSQNDDKDYVITLLVACIDALSGELGLKTDIDPRHLVSETLLRQALTIQYQGVSKAYSLLESDYGFLLDSLENLVH